jgi:uncharacterized surface protein with fasciclin (FAS1) repeats
MLKSLAVAGLAAAALTTVACSSTNPSPVAPSATAAARATDGAPSTIAPAPVADSAPSPGRSSQPTIAEIAVGNPAFSTLVSALVKANLVETFSGRPNYTVFAPTNGAFDQAAKAFGLTDGPALVEALDVPTLTAVLTYHVTRGSRNAAGLVASGKVTMLDGNLARISADGGKVMIENAQIVATDILASNGYVHVIDAVLLPPTLRK